MINENSRAHNFTPLAGKTGLAQVNAAEVIARVTGATPNAV